MSCVFPTGMSVDSLYVYDRMVAVTFESLRAGPGSRVMDSAAGLANDARRLADLGMTATAVDPSKTITDLGVMVEEQKGLAPLDKVQRVRAWSEHLPFADDHFDATFCKGSIDHFADPARAISEMARVTRPDGRVVVAVVNMESLGCKVLKILERLKGRRSRSPGRRHYDVPGDHFTRYDPQVLRDQAESSLRIERVVGISLFWGVRGWSRMLGRMPGSWSRVLLKAADALARRFPSQADLLILEGVPHTRA